LFTTPLRTSLISFVLNPPIDSEGKKFGLKKGFITSDMTPSRTRRSAAAESSLAASVEPVGNKTSGTPSQHLKPDVNSSQSANFQTSSTSAGSGSRRSTKNSRSQLGAPTEASASATLETNKDSNVEIDESKVPATKPTTRGQNGIRKMTIRVSPFLLFDLVAV
jgi:hypothetical protein